MAKKDYNDEDGVWRTIGGRKVFIRKGQNLADAMIESGKFKTKGKMRENYRKEKAKDLKEEDDLYDIDNNENTLKSLQDFGKKAKENEQLYPKSEKEEVEDISKKLDKDTEDLNSYDKYNLAVSKLEQDENMTRSERAYWTKTRDDYVANEKAREKQIDEEKRIKEQLDKERASWTDDDYAKRNRDIQDMKKNVQKSYDDLMEQARLSGNDKLEASAKQFRLDSLRDIDKLEKENRANYDEYRKNKSTNEEQERLDIARDIAKEMYQLNDKNSTQEKIDRYARDIMEYTDGEVTNETPYKDKNGNIQRSTQSLRDWREKLNKTKESSQSTNDDEIVNDIEELKKEYPHIESDSFYAQAELDRNSKASKPKTTNETMNNAIREKASKKKEVEQDLPKATEIKEQGNSNRKEVSENIQAHILDYYDSPDDFVEQMDVFNNLPTKWHVGQEMAKQGFYEIYYDDQRKFLDSLKINPKSKNFSDDRVFETYASLIGRESAKLYDRIKRNQFNQYKKDHPLTKMTFEDFKDMKK